MYTIRANVFIFNSGFGKFPVPQLNPRNFNETNFLPIERIRCACFLIRTTTESPDNVNAAVYCRSRWRGRVEYLTASGWSVRPPPVRVPSNRRSAKINGTTRLPRRLPRPTGFPFRQCRPQAYVALFRRRGRKTGGRGPTVPGVRAANIGRPSANGRTPVPVVRHCCGAAPIRPHAHTPMRVERSVRRTDPARRCRRRPLVPCAVLDSTGRQDALRAGGSFRRGARGGPTGTFTTTGTTVFNFDGVVPEPQRPTEKVFTEKGL